MYVSLSLWLSLPCLLACMCLQPIRFTIEKPNVFVCFPFVFTLRYVTKNGFAWKSQNWLVQNFCMYGSVWYLLAVCWDKCVQSAALWNCYLYACVCVRHMVRIRRIVWWLFLWLLAFTGRIKLNRLFNSAEDAQEWNSEQANKETVRECDCDCDCGYDWGGVRKR